MSKRINVVISDKTYESFQRLAKIGKTSFARTAGGWLDDTAEAADIIVGKMLEHQNIPSGLLAGFGELIDKADDEVADLYLKLGVKPPYGNTGVKSSDNGDKNEQ